MSEDLALRRGDLAIGADGDLQLVRNTTKLTQDVLKVIHTPLGSNPFSPRIGSPLTAVNVGELLDSNFAEQRVETGVEQAIQLIRNIQQQQEIQQEVTAAEKIRDILEIIATRNELEPRQFDISISVQSDDLTSVTIPDFAFDTTIGSDQ